MCVKSRRRASIDGSGSSKPRTAQHLQQQQTSVEMPGVGGAAASFSVLRDVENQQPAVVSLTTRPKTDYHSAPSAPSLPGGRNLDSGGGSSAPVAVATTAVPVVACASPATAYQPGAAPDVVPEYQYPGFWSLFCDTCIKEYTCGDFENGDDEFDEGDTARNERACGNATLYCFFCAALLLLPFWFFWLCYFSGKRATTKTRKMTRVLSAWWAVGFAITQV